MVRSKKVVIVLVTIIFIIVIMSCIVSVVKGNFWFVGPLALKAIKHKDPSIVKIVELERRLWRYGKVVACNEKGFEKEFYIDTDIFQNITVIPIQEE